MLTALRKPPLVANDLYPKSSARIIAFIPTRTSHDRMLLVAVTAAMITAGFMMGLLLRTMPKDALAAGMNFVTQVVIPAVTPAPMPVFKPVEVAVEPAPVMPPVMSSPLVTVAPPSVPAVPTMVTVPPVEASQLIARDVMTVRPPMSVPAPAVEAVTADAAPVIVPQAPAPFDITLAGEGTPDFDAAPVAVAPETFERMIKRAQSALAAGDNETALALYKRVLDADADNTAALTGAAYIYQASGSYDQAADAERRLLVLDATDTAAGTGLAMALGHSDAAVVRKELEALAAANPASAAMQVALARYLAHHQDARGAFDHLQHAIELEPANLAYRLDLAVLYDRAGQASEALTLYRQVLEASPGGLAAVNWGESAQPVLPLSAVRARMEYLAERDGY